MGILDRFKASPAPAPKKLRKREYAGANTGRLFADFGASERSADSELQPVLTKLRSRCRDLARNNEYAKRYLTLLKTNVVGDRGFTLQVKAMTTAGVLDQPGNALVEEGFLTWGRRRNCTADGKMSWLEAQKLAIESLARDGEVLLIKHRSSQFHDTFAIEFIEPDRLDPTHNINLPSGNQVRMGIEFDQYRKPVAYHVMTNHPGDYDWQAGLGRRRERILAENVIHIYSPLRAGQTRGEPWMAPAMNAIKQLGALREAAIINARVGASKMGFFTSPEGDGFAPDDLDGGMPVMSAEPGTFHQLPNGVNFTAFEPQYPSNEFEAFNKVILKGIASALGVSYTALSNDLEATSYSSIRQGALDERDNYRTMQALMIDNLIRPVFQAWLTAAMEMGTIALPLARFDKFANSAQFRGRAWSWVDPQKEMTAAVMGMKNGILSIQDVASQYGKDVEELFSQIVRDRALAKQFGIEYALEPYGAPQAPVGGELDNSIAETEANDV